MIKPLQTIRTILLAQTAVTDLVGTRIYVGEMPQGSGLTSPFIILDPEGGTRAGGGMSEMAPKVEAFVSVECYGTSSIEVENVMEAVTVALQNLHGKQTADTRVGSIFQGDLEGLEKDPQTDLYVMAASFTAMMQAI